LQRTGVIAIVPAQLSPTDDVDDLPTVVPYLTWWVRGSLLLMVGGLTAVFTIAVLLNPYNPDGTPRKMATHTGPPLNLPDCTFKQMTGVPCPSCGMTTSFSLLMHGDPVNSLRANWVGTGLAVFCLALIPWALASVWLRRPLFVVALDRAAAYAVIVFLVFMLLRWGVVLALIWWERHMT
jgi:hypothetical protein